LKKEEVEEKGGIRSSEDPGMNEVKAFAAGRNDYERRN